MSGSDDHTELVALGNLRSNAVFRLPASGEHGQVIAREPAKHVVYCFMEMQGNVRGDPEMRVEHVVDPDDLAAAYARNAAIRTLVDGTLKQMRREFTDTLQRLFG
jgi:hypothetical protein